MPDPFDLAEAAALVTCAAKHPGRLRYQFGRSRPCADCTQDAYQKAHRDQTRPQADRFAAGIWEVPYRGGRWEQDAHRWTPEAE